MFHLSENDRFTTFNARPGTLSVSKQIDKAIYPKISKAIMFREPKKTNPRDPKDAASQTDGLDKKKVEPSLSHEKPLF